MSPVVLILEDHPLFASGVRDLVKLIYPGANVVHATTLAKAVNLFRQDPPIMIVSDLHLPDCMPDDLHNWLQGDAASTPTVLLTADLNYVNGPRAQLRDNLWVIPKQMAFEKASEVIIEAFSAAGMSTYWNQQKSFQNVTEKLIERVAGVTKKKKELTDKQVQVMELVSVGMTNKEIARELSVSPETIKHHMKDIFDRLNATSRTQAVAIFRRMSMIESVH